MTKLTATFGIIYLGAALSGAAAEYRIIATQLSATDALAAIQPLGAQLWEAVPAMILSLVLGYVWYRYCQKAYPSDVARIELPAESTIHERISAANKDLAAVKTGTPADHVFIGGMLAALVGIATYGALVFVGASPVRALFFS